MNKWLLYISFFVGIFHLSAQPEKGSKPSYKEFRKEYKYTKKKNYTGPQRNLSTPVPMEDANLDDEDFEEYDGLKYSQRDIQQSRRSRRSTAGRGGSTGSKQYDPSIEQPPPTDFDPQDDREPLKQEQPSSISPMFWKVLLIIIGFILVAWIVYAIVKNYRPKNQVVPSNIAPSDWNPELIPKTELELRLEAAMLRNDYRECVRIYFTFILKELIRLRRIKWKKELTNIDYLIQLSGKEEYKYFQESIRIYDLVWYGEYEITEQEYQEVVPHLEKNYQSLTATHE